MIKAVFVHLGEAKAPWLKANIRRHRKVFPTIPSVFISDNKELIEQISTDVSEVYFYQSDFEISALLDKTAHNKDFRSNFWRISLERIVAISAYHQTSADSQLLHVESDVLLLDNFPWYVFENNKKLAWMSANEELDCAALLFSPSWLASQSLREAIAEQLIFNTQLTDMSALNYIRRNEILEVELLPSSTMEIADTRLLNQSKRFPEIEKGIAKYGGVFDVLSMGLWLLGENPRNRGGHIVRFEHLYSNDNRFQPDTFSFEGGNFFVGANNPIVLYSLHVHSKDLQLFNENWRKNLERYVKTARSQRRKKSFSIEGYLGSAFDIYISVNRNVIITSALLLRLDSLFRSITRLVGRSNDLK